MTLCIYRSLGFKTNTQTMFLVTLQTQTQRYDKSDNTSRSSTQGGLWMTNIGPSSVDTNGIWTKDTKPRPGQDGWRLPLDHFTPKRQGSKRKARHVSKRARYVSPYNVLE